MRSEHCSLNRFQVPSSPCIRRIYYRPKSCSSARSRPLTSESLIRPNPKPQTSICRASLHLMFLLATLLIFDCFSQTGSSDPSSPEPLPYMPKVYKYHSASGLGLRFQSMKASYTEKNVKKKRKKQFIAEDSQSITFLHDEPLGKVT